MIYFGKLEDTREGVIKLHQFLRSLGRTGSISLTTDLTETTVQVLEKVQVQLKLPVLIAYELKEDEIIIRFGRVPPVAIYKEALGRNVTGIRVTVSKIVFEIERMFDGYVTIES